MYAEEFTSIHISSSCSEESPSHNIQAPVRFYFTHVTYQSLWQCVRPSVLKERFNINR